MIRKQEDVLEWVHLNLGGEFHFQTTYLEVESVQYDSLQIYSPLYESDKLSYFWEMSCAIPMTAPELTSFPIISSLGDR